ncbi:amidohydrolase family protein [Paenibacillus filicis]|uniref:Amidohydrolase family protein n=1 Tax=Paenibacillus gyeongsangnamensis TaxID=3388067 RepID=A0ABT4QGM8_9BACL|nr:amidohydrolase family protein [Paenibacillus filicis]MCZ8516042.1 amidohydrolase family protein [Paenibacillus filicis]
MIIDFHTHLLGGNAFNLGLKKGHEAIQVMDRYAVDKAVIFTVDGFWGDYIDDNTYMYTQSQAYPDRLFPFATINPRDGKRGLLELKRCLPDLQMRGIKFHPWLQGFSPLESFMDDIAKVAIEYDVPILFHDGTPPYTSPLQIALLAAKFPELKVVLGHAGLMDLWPEAIVAANRHPNVYLNFSGGTPYKIYEKIIGMTDIDKIVFGSDVFGDDYVLPYQLGKIGKLAIDDESKRKILGENAMRLLKLN